MKVSICILSLQSIPVGLGNRGVDDDRDATVLLSKRYLSLLTKKSYRVNVNSLSMFILSLQSIPVGLGNRG